MRLLGEGDMSCAQGVLNGPMASILSMWAPPLERTKLSAVIYAGNG